MKTFARALAAALLLAVGAITWSAPPAGAQDARAQIQVEPAATVAHDFSAGKRRWKRHGWHGKRKWKRHGWRGHRRWHARRWYGRRYWRGGACFGSRGRCISVWRAGRRVIVCCR